MRPIRLDPLTKAQLAELDHLYRIGRLAALSGERNGERRGRYRLLCLAHNWLAGRFLEASCRLGGKPTGHFL